MTSSTIPTAERTTSRRSSVAGQFLTEHAANYTEQELQFARAVDDYKRTERRPFPTSREVLAVVLSLGYRQVAEAGPLPKAG